MKQKTKFLIFTLSLLGGLFCLPVFAFASETFFIDKDNVRFNPAEYALNESVTITVDVKNEGEEPVEGKLIFSADDQVLGEQDISEEPDTELTFSAKWFTPSEPGEVTLSVQLLAADGETEEDLYETTIDVDRIPTEDEDEDGVNNLLDNCPVDANPEQEDIDENGIGDACDTPEVVLDSEEVEEIDPPLNLGEDVQREDAIEIPVENRYTIEDLVSVHVEQIGWGKYRLRPSLTVFSDSFTYFWNFSDGEKATGKNVQKSFKSPGAYSATLELRDGDRYVGQVPVRLKVEFFNLANWQMWIILGVLVLIALIAIIFLVRTRHIVHAKNIQKKMKPSLPLSEDKDSEELEDIEEDEEPEELDLDEIDDEDEDLTSVGDREHNLDDDLEALSEVQVCLETEDDPDDCDVSLAADDDHHFSFFSRKKKKDKPVSNEEVEDLDLEEDDEEEVIDDDSEDSYDDDLLAEVGDVLEAEEEEVADEDDVEDEPTPKPKKRKKAVKKKVKKTSAKKVTKKKTRSKVKKKATKKKKVVKKKTATKTKKTTKKKTKKKK